MFKLAETVRCQGLAWACFRLRYAAKIRAGWLERRLPQAAWTGLGPNIVEWIDLPADGDRLGTDRAVILADKILAGTQRWFSRHEFEVGFPPDWFHDPWSPGKTSADQRHWSRIGDFDGGDIKAVWELGRFGFTFPLVRAFAHSRSDRYPEAFWRLVEDWAEKNPPQSGPHWKCGQEVALRAIAWSFGLCAFRGHGASTPQRQALMAEMLETAGRRIEANIEYALNQKNNHGVSEAAGMFTAGVLLGRDAWIQRGRELLDLLACELIYGDGSFTQQSANYHRLMLHDYLWAIVLGDSTGNRLTQRTLERVRSAGIWLWTLLPPAGSENFPNLGPNDGAHLLDLTDLGYRDYRPSIQAVGLVTEGRRWLAAGPWDELAIWLGAAEKDEFAEDVAFPDGPDFTMREFADGGYVVWRNASTLGLLRCPRRFRHRPAQCDLLHFDLWHDGRNLLRDAGSFSYNCEEPWQSYFSSAAAHNTIEFDGRDPMPRLSRFLYGAWPRVEVNGNVDRVSAAYRNYQGAFHRRTVSPAANGFQVEDELGGSFKTAVLRWRLDPDIDWSPTHNGCCSGNMELIVHSHDVAAVSCRLSPAWESLYYKEKTQLPALEVEVTNESRMLTTTIRLL